MRVVGLFHTDQVGGRFTDLVLEVSSHGSSRVLAVEESDVIWHQTAGGEQAALDVRRPMIRLAQHEPVRAPWRPPRTCSCSRPVWDTGAWCARARCHGV